MMVDEGDIIGVSFLGQTLFGKSQIKICCFFIQCRKKGLSVKY